VIQHNGTLRGDIENRDRRLQIYKMSGMQWGLITPSDLDAAIDFGGRLFVFIEGKHGAATIPAGQRILLENLCKAIYLRGVKHAYAIEAEHDVTDARLDVDMANMRVRRMFCPELLKWRDPAYYCTVKRLVDWLRSKHGFTSTMP
jgi:hypothetical protein